MKTFILAVLIASSAQAQSLLTTLTATSGNASYTSTLGASLLIQCNEPIRYAQGNAVSPPTADGNSLLLAFSAASAAQPIQLDSGNDRISVRGGVLPSFTCRVYSGPVAATTVAGSQCTILTQTVVSVGVAAVAVPASAQPGRASVEICVSAENAGSPKVKCLVDPAVGKPAMGVTEKGHVLQAGGVACVTYPVDSTHPISCISDTAATAVTTSECYIP